MCGKIVGCNVTSAVSYGGDCKVFWDLEEFSVGDTSKIPNIWACTKMLLLTPTRVTCLRSCFSSRTTQIMDLRKGFLSTPAIFN